MLSQSKKCNDNPNLVWLTSFETFVPTFQQCMARICFPSSLATGRQAFLSGSCFPGNWVRCEEGWHTRGETAFAFVLYFYDFFWFFAFLRFIFAFSLFLTFCLFALFLSCAFLLLYFLLLICLLLLYFAILLSFANLLSFVFFFFIFLFLLSNGKKEYMTVLTISFWLWIKLNSVWLIIKINSQYDREEN